MSAELLTLDPKSIHILEILKALDASSLSKMEKDGVHYVLKVYHNNGDPSTGAGAGAVPYYHGYIERLNPEDFSPYLRQFTLDEFHPPAIVLEFLPGAEELNCVNYSRDRFGKAVRGLEEVHAACVLHYDVYPRNVLIVTGQEEQEGDGDGERVVWVDSDVVVTYSSREAMP